MGSLAELLSHPLCPFPKKLEDTGETHRFSIARICGVLSVWNFQSRFCSLLGVRLAKREAGCQSLWVGLGCNLTLVSALVSNGAVF